METIKMYLENMFMNLPNSEQVKKAKTELLSMMEDKYNELKAEGKTENEAVGIVISEFGNLDEIAGELGIRETVERAAEMPMGTVVTMDIVKEYLKVNAISARRIAIGVFMCICSPILLIVLSGMSETYMGISEDLTTGIGMSVLLVLVAISVGLFIINGIALGKYEYLQKETFQMEYPVKQYVSQLQDGHKSIFALHVTIGVVLCIIGVIPLIIMGCINDDNEFLMCVTVGILLFMVAIAVLFFITAGMEEGAYNILLQKGEYAPEAKNNKLMQSISSVYWTIVTAGYLLWSFVTYDWHNTWIIWPIAGVLFGGIAAIINMTQHKDN